MVHPAIPPAWRRARHALLGLMLVFFLAAPSAPALATVTVNGGSVSNNTSLGLATNGGTSIGDANGGSGNVAFTTACGNFNNNNRNNNCNNCCNNCNNNRNNNCCNNNNRNNNCCNNNRNNNC